MGTAWNSVEFSVLNSGDETDGYGVYVWYRVLQDLFLLSILCEADVISLQLERYLELELGVPIVGG